MGRDIVPSFYGLGSVLGQGFSDGGAWNNDQFRAGEIKRAIPPSDEDSRSKLFWEYDVLVTHRENGTAVSKIYHNCLSTNLFGGLADKFHYTLRTADGDQEDATPGTGPRVTILCLDGNEVQGIIVNGLRSEADKDDESKGHHLVFEFNGVLFEINDDGSWTLTNKGKTNLLGGADQNRNEEGSGTQVKVEANGNFQVTTPKGQSVKIDNINNSITIDSDSKVTINTAKAVLNASQVDIGAAPTFSNVLGEPLAAVLSLICTTVGPTLPTLPQRAAIATAASQLSTILSSSVKVQG